ncbi:hypothetical protein PBCVNY2B_238R [Paramecium bursaria Chlorella virus NY2B]|uniref:Uncharacterized protein n=1 Tax=Paramecium bursaria Chlorella virus NYs1 TaxID=83442 RepID=M1I817_9PHYC|nr:hypothetical protein FK949_gp079 [Paramecium bursaria Chlorella virus NYs1]AGE54148.1 hypothetical protein PBCVIL52s1_230R [Paramecium bursaria Chlorella virus IL-5-2s1]AGE54793.1 hypothetical protein PBCVMA1D_115R [Paramecium bursaria Chlorella virus MA1D]AGE58271.1 hypothetical protein PBCVNY2B_238R [Paramecium bursaria Chlorella virus NY2B]AGE58644.1 hypothetical protein PBCVNYs1_218R [Paramecium bursaria Chlorella virus NYs1]
MNTKFDNSISKMKTSFEEINNAKTRIVILDTPASRKTIAGTKKKIVTQTQPKKEEISKPIELTNQPKQMIRDSIIIEKKKRKMPRKSKLAKLVKGKTVFDFSK